MRDLLLRAVVTAHDDHELCLISGSRRAEHGRGDEVTMGEGGDEAVELDRQGGEDLQRIRQYIERDSEQGWTHRAGLDEDLQVRGWLALEPPR